MDTVILCGGKGTRLGHLAEQVPKPLVEVGDEPILWHIMKLYESFGHRRFILCLGHLAHKFGEYVAGSDFDLDVELVDTGQDTPTGGRVKRIADTVRGERFFATYGDGLADIDLDALLAFHRAHGRIATLTSVRPYGNFGILHADGNGRVTAFEEKPRMTQWVNGGFFVFERAIFDYLDEQSVLEREPLERLAAEGELMAYPHAGFWACMDTYKDNIYLNERWETGMAEWKIWGDE
jgi:glucose-1-phosphate cytidylyltransferase